MRRKRQDKIKEEACIRPFFEGINLDKPDNEDARQLDQGKRNDEIRRVA